MQGEVTSTVCVTLFFPTDYPSLICCLPPSLGRTGRNLLVCLYECVNGLLYMFSIPEASARGRSKRTHALCRSTYTRFYFPPNQSLMIRLQVRACISTRLNLEKTGKKERFRDACACVVMRGLLPGSPQFTFTSADLGN